MRSRWALGFALGLAALSVTSAPRVADACGGCFNQPPPMPTAVSVVTYHRMALSVAATQTTLWDQFGYAGNPGEFSWILPIRSGPDVRVELADVRFLAALDDMSSAQIPGPPPAPRRQCPYCYNPPPAESHYCGFDSSFPGGTAAEAGVADASTGADVGAFSDAGVTVLRMEAVGPYELTVLRGSDANSLRAWLTANRYVVPAGLDPTLDFYINQRMDFVALRLRDGEGVGSMQPVRVTVPGYQPVLPLRMVAAGVGDSVELVLMVLAAPRMEAMNFPATVIPNDMLEWDYATPPSTTLRAFRNMERALSRESGNRAWLTESAVANEAGTLRAQAAAAATRWRAESDAGNPMQDMEVALAGIGERPYLSRLHADLPKGMLDRDLMVGPSTLSAQPRAYRFGRFLNSPTPPACAPLTCSSGLVAGPEGEIVDPLGTVLAPDSIMPPDYRRGSFVPYRLQYNGRPRYLDGRGVFTPTPTRYIDDCAPGMDGGRTEAGVTDTGVTDARGSEVGGVTDAGPRFDATVARSDGGPPDARPRAAAPDARVNDSYTARGGCTAAPVGATPLAAPGALTALFAALAARRRSKRAPRSG